MADSEGENKEFDLVQRLKRVEYLTDETPRSRTWQSQSGAAKMIPMIKEKMERLRRRSRSRSSEFESDANFIVVIARMKQGQRERGRRTYNRTKRLEDEEDSDWDSEEHEVEERSQGFLGAFPDEWLMPLRQVGELKKVRKGILTGHTHASWNAIAVTAITAEGRNDSPEAIRVIELLQPALESGFETAKAIGHRSKLYQ
ncbi:uncharacterized protein MONOS_9345 [Monocercomonoides exilis]|uniref:uncharacterized protein n=1 Tax=Monocercomonoides exilis TaxID=2049356 RepID=UPI00355A0647|nr:hypothetical protein MONOS_9345 [Monocercomonoides exilis]|eukprot:MONOS_9345.1-p1 / transcript=MONOS_9345.1 / gene=MONOS_9345 / organism=Monocercomonoides_exilis_PA203 / gene_product=unspecified product / transcript_product=unspecified product / location=Mono_scaffold00382:34357-35024(-) / protein_length=200 / sequence_SO=supercontig / SO=protein_coding / is_pseudo=false